MDYRSPLQHLLRTLRPSRDAAEAAVPNTDFVDTRPVERPAPPALRNVAKKAPGTWAESALDLQLGTEIMEYPEDTAADLMDEFFAKADQRAA
jgi:hypothetical protein